MRWSHWTGAALGMALLVVLVLWWRERARSQSFETQGSALAQQVNALSEELKSLQELKTQAKAIAAMKVDAEELQSLRKEHSELLRLRNEAAQAREKAAPFVTPSTAMPVTRSIGSGRNSVGAENVDPEQEAAYKGYIASPRNTISWSPGQAAGAPDTHQSGDISTAWASQSPDGGAEWLALEYERPVELAQVRIRETYNPGAVSAITAILDNGTEVPLWEGHEAKAEAPVEVEFNLPAGITSRMVRVHLDTTRVSGWNEIDAVELVGRDGSRQWAKSASASSYFGQNNPRNLERLNAVAEGGLR